MARKYIYILLLLLSALGAGADANGQVDRRDVRRGNRDFRKENFEEAEIDYRKAQLKDTSSVAANYNLANTLFRMENPQDAQKTLDRVKETAAVSPYAADYYFNLGDAALANQDYRTAVEAFAESLLRNPGDVQAKENYIYAKKKLQDQQQNQQQNQDNAQNQDQNQNNGQDQNNDQDDRNQDNKDDGQNDQEQNGDNEDKDDRQNDGGQDQQKQNPQQGQNKITPQAAQQMLQAIQAKEKETQDKVNRQKAEALKSRQKEKNW